MSASMGSEFVRALRVLAVASLSIGTASLAAATPPRCSARLISTDIVAVAMNEAGDVVGTNNSPMRAWVSRAGAMAELLPLPPGYATSWARDINDLGVIVGAVGPSPSPEFNGRAAAWTPDGAGGYTVEVLGTLPGQVRSDAAAINNLGDVVGFSSDGTYRSAVLFTAPGGVQDLSTAGVFDPTDINDQRVLVDHSFTSRTLDLDTMEVEDLGTPGQGYLASTGAAINESGQVAGLVILTSTTCDRQAARYTDGVGWEVFSTCGPYNGAADINDFGDLVMSNQLSHFVRFDGMGTYHIDDLIDADEGEWFLLSFSSLAINNARQLVVSATNPALDQTGVLLLTPIAIPGDVDGDGTVDGEDLAILLGSWGKCAECAADLNGDGHVDGADLAALLGGWTG